MGQSLPTVTEKPLSSVMLCPQALEVGKRVFKAAFRLAQRTYQRYFRLASRVILSIETNQPTS